ncbi:MAG: isoleucine--tRNA ligase [Candidatus Tyrphobacter sp.]
MSDYRSTLNLPVTSFAMKAELAKREPARVEWWERERTYERRLKRNDGAPPRILHDGPPYANGELHMGTFFNMVLKDMYVKIALLDGAWAKFVPGWDMHGLPIELEALRHLGIKDFHAVDPLELRARCKERALFWLERQRATRMRMGAFGEFEHPYRTIDPSFESTIVRALADLAEKDQIYKGLRATLWCWHDETALAEAEIEYENRTSPSITVRFAFDDEQRAALLARMAAASDKKASVLIWTTTPWTLPANAAIALHPRVRYALYDLGDEVVLLAQALAERVLGDRYPSATTIAVADGATFEGLRARHPLLDRDSQIVLAEYVDLETGTGAVHTAPGHGGDDFETGIKYSLPILSPVDAAGRFTSDVPAYAGTNVFDANAKIVDDLRGRGALWSAEEIEHSYPHCWRCHNPVIFRATAQWFISMDRNDLRTRALAAIDTVEYTPAWGRDRQRQMIEAHPEWCISRQRTWGTPIPSVRCIACDRSILDPTIARNAAERFAREGADAWWRDPVDVYLPPGFACPSCGATRFEAERNIVDIWFESGVTHLAVLGHDGLPWPSNAVLEGADQYRGWFRSSLVTAAAIRGGAPYKRVIKNGWVNDEHGRAMSKSRGTGIDARDAMERYGADVLRLWTASVEFFDDVRFGPNVVEQVARVYRNVRNRIRFMLGNVGDLPAERVAPQEMHPLDRFACRYAGTVFAQVHDAYDAFDVHGAYLTLVEFEGSVSALYFDALKDTLYSRAAADPRRRSAQSALLHILRGLLAALAPVLAFTAEEAWQALPEHLKDGRDSVFDLALERGERDERVAEDWNALRDLRAKISAGELRDFEAQATLRAPRAFYERWSWVGDRRTLCEVLREALVVSALALEEGGEAVSLDVTPAAGEKCARCWKFRRLGNDAAHPGVCAECAAVLDALRD